MSKCLATQDGSRTLYSTRYQQTYHSHFGARTEARHTFLDASGVTQRLQRGLPSRVLELGFGVGLNFLLTADLALKHKCPLAYVAYENNLVDSTTFQQLGYADLLENPCMASALLPLFDKTSDLIKFTQNGINSDLTLHSSDLSRACFLSNVELEANAQTQIKTASTSRQFDAVYLDAFSPEVNPECWTLPVMRRLYSCLKPGASLTSYCVKGTVRRVLREAGFGIEKLPGPPGKREILRASTTL